MHRIPVYQPSLNGNERKYVNECLDSTWISSKGRFVNKFESAFAKFINVSYAAGVCNGTSALHLALIALGIGKGDEVIVPTLTYIASANAVAYTGARPVFVDCLHDTWQMDPEDVKKKVTSKTKAIMAVHLYGHPCNMDELGKITKTNHLYLIEDCAEAIGGKYNGRHVGTFGDVSSFSFFGNKTLTTGEGGMVCTHDATLYDRLVHYKGQGLAKGREYWHDVIGYNYRMTNICAAIGLAQLEQVEAFLKKKKEIACWYKEKLKGLPVEVRGEYHGAECSYWMISILVDKDENRDPLRELLKLRGVETRPLFYPIHTMPMYLKKGEKHPVAENLSARGMSLPSFPGLSEEEVKFVCSIIKEFYSNGE